MTNRQTLSHHTYTHTHTSVKADLTRERELTVHVVHLTSVTNYQ